MKILIAGMGSIGQRHARNIRRVLGADVELLAFRVLQRPHVVTPQLEADATRNVEDEYGLRTFTGLPQALAAKPDAVFICNPTSLHLETARAAIDAGCDVFIEKPLSHSMGGVAELIAAAARGGRVAMVGYQLRFHPCIRAAADALRAGAAGPPLAVRATVGEYMPGFHRYEDYRSTYPARAGLGGGVVLSQIHEFDYLCSLFGLPRRVFAIGGHWSGLEIDVEDTASILMECETAGRPLPVHLQQDFLQRPPARSCEIVCERGKIVVDFPSLSVTVSLRDGGAPTVESFAGLDRNQLFLDELRHFLACMESRARPVVDLAEGARSLRVALAAKESIGTGRVVELAGESHGVEAV